MPRKPIGCCILGTVLVVVCDDGTVWELDPTGEWNGRRPVPGTEAALSRPAEPAFEY